MGKAIEHFQTAVRLNPNYAEAHNNLGSAYAEKGLMDKAIEHFQIAAKLIPSNQTFRNNLTKAYEMKSSAVKAGHKTGSSKQK
jgi:Flp pilus assembly protein TadD